MAAAAEGVGLLSGGNHQGDDHSSPADDTTQLQAEEELAESTSRQAGGRWSAIAVGSLVAAGLVCALCLQPRRLSNEEDLTGIIGEAFAVPQTPAMGPQAPVKAKSEQAGPANGVRPQVERPPQTHQPDPTTRATTQATTPEPTPDPYADCPVTGGDCREAKCCKDPGTQCFAKNEYWAECKVTCEKGINLGDPDDTPWSCDELGKKTPGEPKQCSKEGEDCSKSECCAEPGTQCYRKNKYWATCKTFCEPGPDLMAPESDSWSCEEVGPRKPGAGEWVAEKGAQSGQDCSQIGFCAEEGHQCFKKDDGWSECRTECEAGWKENPWDTEWSCEAIGPVTPRSTRPGSAPKGQVASWVSDTCKSEGENCMEAQCCKSVGWRCHKKNEFWAQCLYECPPGGNKPEPDDDAGTEEGGEQTLNGGDDTWRRLAANTEKSADIKKEPEDTWDCSAMGPESWGLAVKGYPSLYCVSLYMPSSYEGGLINQQLADDAGIFACDGYDVIASEDTTVGTSKDGILVKTLHIDKIDVGVSQDGTAGNAKLFMAMWDIIVAGKRFRDYDWTIKADPDAVLIPWRLRDHMRSHVGENVYVVNCNKFPSSPNFPMMFGSVEIFSSAAMIAYADGSWKCGQDLPWAGWGEDYYMTHCLDYLGVGRISDFTVVGDNVCTGANCLDGGVASFHPMKTAEDWKKCWQQAVPA